MSATLKLRFGAMPPFIREQLIEQGFTFENNEIEHFQKDADAITRLRVRGLIPDSQIDKMNKKLINKIASCISKLNP